MTVENCVG